MLREYLESCGIHHSTVIDVLCHFCSLFDNLDERIVPNCSSGIGREEIYAEQLKSFDDMLAMLKMFSNFNSNKNALNELQHWYHANLSSENTEQKIFCQAMRAMINCYSEANELSDELNKGVLAAFLYLEKRKVKLNEETNGPCKLFATTAHQTSTDCQPLVPYHTKRKMLGDDLFYQRALNTTKKEDKPHANYRVFNA